MARIASTAQLPLFSKALDKESSSIEGTKESFLTPQTNGFRDPAFTKNRVAPVHRWVPWIAGFSAQFIEDVFTEYLPARSSRCPLVLDPFAGVGTTLVQAMLHGYNTVGFEINPYAALVIRTKLKAASLDLSKLDALIQAVESAPMTWNGEAAPEQHRPVGFRSRIPFFSERVEPQVLRLLELLEHIPDRAIADVARIAFGAVMVKISNYTYEPSLSSRPGAGKPLLEDADVPAILAAKLREIKEDVVWLQQNVSNTHRRRRRDVHCADFLTMNDCLATESVDLMVTSPPYMNNYHYVRNTRPQLFWLALVAGSSDLRQLEQSNFGKYWQTVRDAEPIPLQCNHAELAHIVDELRKTRVMSGAYGGPGWANYVTSYFNDCDRFVKILTRVLRSGGIGVVVIGNSIIQGISIATDRMLGDLAEAQGLKLERIIPLRAKRVGSSITGSSVRRGEKNGAKLYETAVMIRKP